MGRRKAFRYVLASARMILESEILTSGMLEQWYRTAERALLDAFGVDWHDPIMWTGHKSRFIWDGDRRLLETHVQYLEQAQMLLGPDESMDVSAAPQTAIPDTPSPNEEPIESATATRMFIVHGHNDVANLELKNYLQNVLKLPEPIILHEQANQG